MKFLFLGLLGCLCLSGCEHAPSQGGSLQPASYALQPMRFDGAGVPDGTEIEPTLVAPLLAWIANELHLPAVPTAPKVVASRDKFHLVARASGVRYSDIRAMYVPGMIILDSDSWDSQDAVQRSILLHEMVHHVQLSTRRTFPCIEAKEWEAYALQNKWLELQGEDAFASADWIERLSRCSEAALAAARASAGVPELMLHSVQTLQTLSENKRRVRRPAVYRKHHAVKRRSGI